LGGGIGLAVLAAVLVAIPMFNLFHAHEHCIKGTGLSLRTYALRHNGRFPFHTNGFGDAILLLLKEDDYPYEFTAPGDDGSLFKACLKTGAHMPEDRCTRAYVQGLGDTNNPMIALVFDRYPTRGGDHFRRPWGPLLREVAMLDGSMEVIREEKWPEFRRNQIELLVAEGISRAEAEKLYAPFK
jgi:hypothetical protein